MSDPNVSTTIHVPAGNGKSIALPPTVAALMAQKKSGKQRTLNDMVEGHHLKLYEDAKYRGYLDATVGSDSKEGSLIADDMMAALMIREQASEAGDVLVAKKNLATIRTSLHVVLRRYGISRKERRDR